MKVNILGTEYTIEYRKREDDPNLENADGYHDSTQNLIVIEDLKPEKGSKGDLEAYKKQVLRHEIIHAFLFQSGLDNCSACLDGAWATFEEMIDWFAIQSPKIYKAFEECDCM